MLLPVVSYANETPVQLKADKLSFDENTGMLTAKGSTEAHFEDLTIEADSIIIDTNSNLATAEGNLKIKSGDYSGTAASLTYNSSSKTVEIINFFAALKSTDVKGTVYLTAKKLFDKKEKRIGLDGTGTTCEYLDPHYDVLAQRFEYYPDDMIIGYNATFNIADIPVLYTPIFFYSLRKRSTSLLFPVFGSNRVEGDFIKTTLNYRLNNDNWGSIFLDEMSIKGFGKGFEHNYLSGRNDGSLYLYNVPEQDTGINSWATRFKQNFYIKDTTKMSFGYEYLGIYAIYGGRFDQTKSNFNIDHKYGKNLINLGYNRFDNRISNMDAYTLNYNHKYDNTVASFLYDFQASKNSPRRTSTTERVNYSTPIPHGGWSVSSSFTSIKNTTIEGAAAEEKIYSQIDLAQNQKLYNLKITQSWFQTPGGNGYAPADNTEYLEKLPEVILNPVPADFKLFQLSSSFGYGRYHEVKYMPTTNSIRNFISGRFSETLRATASFPLILGTTINLAGGLDQYQYDPGDQRYVKSEHHTLNTSLLSFFNNNVDYNRAIADGNTPFFFDSTGANLQTITDIVTFYYQNKYKITFDSGYNFVTRKKMDITGKLYIDPEKRLHIYMVTGYDLENKIWRSWSTNLTLLPYDKFRWDIASSYDLNIGRLLTASSLLDFEIGNCWQNSWHFKISHLYDVALQQFQIRDLAITKDLHCWESTFAYSDFRKEFRISFKIKAFPSQPIGYVTGNQGTYFDGFFKDQSLQGLLQQK